MLVVISSHPHVPNPPPGGMGVWRHRACKTERPGPIRGSPRCLRTESYAELMHVNVYVKQRGERGWSSSTA